MLAVLWLHHMLRRLEALCMPVRACACVLACTRSRACMLQQVLLMSLHEAAGVHVVVVYV
jgi:hypothetical protein